MNQGGRGAACFLVLLAASLAPAPLLQADDALQWSGFATLRAASNAAVPLDSDRLSAQLQLGIDWSRSPRFLCHVHLVARSDDGQAERGHAGSPEAYLETNLRLGASHVRLRGGAFFLPTSRENVDALWENPYAISSSALNTWFGEELRPVGLDLSWQRGGAVLGATLYRGNDTLGALPIDRGWALNDRWTLLGEKVALGEGSYTSVSAETDHRLGWSARAGWNARRFSILFTRIDNRSDGLQHRDLENWLTRFNVAGADYGAGDWTVAGETGWGTTEIFFPGGSFASDLRASYLLVSRRLPRGRVSLRFDAFSHVDASDRALTLAGFWTPVARLRAGLELSAGGGARRVLGELRYNFAGR